MFLYFYSFFFFSGPSMKTNHQSNSGPVNDEIRQEVNSLRRSNLSTSRKARLHQSSKSKSKCNILLKLLYYINTLLVVFFISITKFLPANFNCSISLQLFHIIIIIITICISIIFYFLILL